MATPKPRVAVSEHYQNTMAPAYARSVIGKLEKHRHYIKCKREYTDEERADIERTIAKRISWQHFCDLEEYVLDYQGYPLSVIRAFDGSPAVFLGGRDGIVVAIKSLEDSELLAQIDKELDSLIDDAVFETEMFWFTLGFHAPDVESPEKMMLQAICSFRGRVAELDGGFLNDLDAADRDAEGNPERTAQNIVGCLTRLGYYCAGSGYRNGSATVFVQSPVDSDLLEFIDYDPEQGLKMAAVYLGTLPVPARLATGASAIFFDTGSYTVSNEGKLFALKTWGHTRARMPVTAGIAEFCLFDKMVCDVVYGTENTPRWKSGRSSLPVFEQEREGAYEHVKSLLDSLSEENYLYSSSQPERPENSDVLSEWKLKKYRGER